MNRHFSQLTLKIPLEDNATFNNFFIGNNKQPVAYLQDISQGLGEQFVYLWGAPSTGRSHLLQASCHLGHKNGLSTIYIPFHELNKPTINILNNLASIELVCLDDIETIIGQKSWEEALFHTFNQIQESKGRLLVSTNSPPRHLEFLLPDLQSRLETAIVFQLQPLTDEQKIIALQKRANNRGLDLSQKAGEYLLNKYSRDPKSLFIALEKLDKTSLSVQRKLTIPFIKLVLE